MTLLQAKELIKAGDAMQSAASRVVEWLTDGSVVSDDPPEEIELAVLELRAAVDAWTEARRKADRCA